jgi:predicted GNAT family N-acyltransferase
MTDDIVQLLKRRKEFTSTTADIFVEEAIKEIERLRLERVEWFIAAQKLAWKAVEGLDLMPEVDHYLKTRGKYEDPRSCREHDVV